MMQQFDYMDLQDRYPGRYIALRNGEVAFDAPTYDALIDEIQAQEANWSELLIMRVERPDVVAIY